MIQGKDIKIFNSSNTALIAGARSCLINRTAEAIEKSSSAYATDKEYIAGRKGWSVDLAYLVTTGVDGMLMVGSTYSIKVVVASGNNTNTVLQGSAICVECDIQATRGNLATGTIKLQGTGPLAPPAST